MTGTAIETGPAASGNDRRQLHSASLFEAVTNVIFGFLLAFVVQGIVYPLLGIVTTVQVNLLIAAIFTALSVVRSYCVRRAFETFR
jgi:predicted membrane protein